MPRCSIGDARFFTRSGPHSIATVAEAAGGTTPETDLLLTGVAPLQAAGPDEVSFLDNRRYAAALEKTSAGAATPRSRHARTGPGRCGADRNDRTLCRVGAGWPPCSTRRRPRVRACTRRRSSRTARPSIRQRRLDLSS